MSPGEIVRPADVGSPFKPSPRIWRDRSESLMSGNADRRARLIELIRGQGRPHGRRLRTGGDARDHPRRDAKVRRQRCDAAGAPVGIAQ